MRNKTEKQIQNEILNEFGSKPFLRLFRNNSGIWYQGTPHFTGDREVLLTDYRRSTTGLAPGASDLIGLQRMIITPEMVGNQIARFVSIEVKRNAKARLKPEQENWLKMVRHLGGYAECVWRVEDLIL